MEMAFFCYLWYMLGLSTKGSTNTNLLQINIPDELKGIDLQIIILPSNKENSEIEFFTSDELQLLSKINIGTPLDDNEDYSKW